jgi:hypothetical protein
MTEPTPALPVTSSVPPQFPKDQEDLFRDVLTAFEQAHLPYVVSGAFALKQHTGICRYTKDLDIFLSPDDAPAVCPTSRKKASSAKCVIPCGSPRPIEGNILSTSSLA